MLEVELTEPIPAILEDSALSSGRRHRLALTLVRLHTRPIGVARVPLARSVLSPEEHAWLIWDQLRSEIEDHLALDGLPPAASLGPGGLAPTPNAACCRERAAALLHAPTVSVVVPTRNRPAPLDRCLRTLLSCDYPPERLTVVVVGSGSSTAAADAEVCRRQGAGRVLYVATPTPGAAHARNIGLRRSTGDPVLFLDDDVVVDRYWLVDMVAGFRRAARVACVTGLILPLELKTAAQTWLEQYGGFGKGFSGRVVDISSNKPSDPLFPFRIGSHGSGASMGFRRSIFEAIGPFDESLGPGTPTMSGEDVEMFLRILLSGRSIVYEPAAIVRHLHAPDFETLRRRVYAYGVGATAVLMRTALSRPRVMAQLVRVAPRGVRFALASGSDKHAGKTHDYPGQLRREEVRGMTCGAVAFMRSRRAMRRMPASSESSQ